MQKPLDHVQAVCFPVGGGDGNAGRNSIGLNLRDQRRALADYT